jgi:hypothetical protein
LIRHNLSTVWCEVTSSIRTREAESGDEDSISDEASPPDALAEDIVKRPQSTTSEGGTNETSSAAPVKQVKEVLFCFRPIRDGEKKAAEKFRFKPRHRHADAGTDIETTQDQATKGEGMTVTVSASSITEKKRKRDAVGSSGTGRKLRQGGLRNIDNSDRSVETEKSTAESLIMMNQGRS